MVARPLIAFLRFCRLQQQNLSEMPSDMMKLVTPRPNHVQQTIEAQQVLPQHSVE
jgi:hypothetical protein